MKLQVKSKSRVANHGEVFTADREVNAMVDLVKHETERIDSRCLEPACGDGNFLAEILRRKLAVVKSRYRCSSTDYEHFAVMAVTSIYGVDLLPDNIEECRNRLFQIFDEEYTANCKKDANDKCRDAVRFILSRNILCGDALTLTTADGAPIIFSEWSVAAASPIDALIHSAAPKTMFDMRFDVIVGNPPYHLSDGGGNGTSAVPIYHKFVEQAMKLNPRYVTMIVPSRWFTGGKGLNEFRDKMLHDNRIRQIHDYPEASDCFPGVQIKGGVSYFLWDRDHPGECAVTTHRGHLVGETSTRTLLEPGCDTFIRYNEAIHILRKVQQHEPDFRSMEELVSFRRPFNIDANFACKTAASPGDFKIYKAGGYGYIEPSQVPKNKAWADAYKVLIAKAGSGSDSFPHSILGRPFVGGPGTVCTETYLVIGPFDSEATCEYVCSYIRTKFFRFMVLLKKSTQNAARGVYAFVPVQDFSKPWTDEVLYAKYDITDDEIAFIDSLIRPMDG